MKQFVEKFLDAFYKRAPASNRDAAELSAQNTKQSEVVQEFYKKIQKYIHTSASIRAYLERLNHIKNLHPHPQHSSSQPEMQTYEFMGGSSSGGGGGGGYVPYQEATTLAQLSHHLRSSSNATEDYGEKLYEAIMIMVESYVNASLYDHVFPAIMSEYEEQDMSLQKRIRGFYWITNEMIGTCIDEHSIFYRDSYEEALNCIYK